MFTLGLCTEIIHPLKTEKPAITHYTITTEYVERCPKRHHIKDGAWLALSGSISGELWGVWYEYFGEK